jgi:hypothetical protein
MQHFNIVDCLLLGLANGHHPSSAKFRMEGKLLLPLPFNIICLSVIANNYLVSLKYSLLPVKIALLQCRL